MSKQKLLAIILSVIVVVAIIAGIIVAGSPAQERTRRADDQRVNDLQSLSVAINRHYANEGALPESLEHAARQPDVYVQRITDPQTNEPYGYTTTSDTTYQLCATFEMPTPQDTVNRRESIPPELSFWSHDSGTHCYDLDAQPVETKSSAPPR